MTLSDFVASIPDFHRKSTIEKIELFAWHAHEVKNQYALAIAELSACFDTVHEGRPSNIHRDVARLCERKPPRMLKDPKGVRLAASVRQELSNKINFRHTTAKTTALLDGLANHVTNPAHQIFLAETLTCFRSKAYRAAIVMAWNLAFSDVVDRIFSSHLSQFNIQRAKAFSKTKEISKLSDFEDLKESTVLEIARGAGILSASSFKILDEKLGRRNTAAHPSSVVVGSISAEEVIHDLVANIILRNPL